jgi:hypothetical protein
MIHASRGVDRAFGLFGRLRAELVLALADDAVLDRFNDLTYSGAGDYDPSSDVFLDFLFPWEQAMLDRFFPQPPARVLVGGAGSGREAFALVERGYEVVAFEPSTGLARSMAKRVGPGMKMEVYRAAYEDLPTLSQALPEGAPASVEDLGPFEASLLGLGSFTHLRRAEDRAATLRAFGSVTEGPVVVSFLRLRTPVPTQGMVRRTLVSMRARRGRAPSDGFSLETGFFHRFEEGEIEELAARSGLDVAHHDVDERKVYPHAVLIPRSQRDVGGRRNRQKM